MYPPLLITVLKYLISTSASDFFSGNSNVAHIFGRKIRFKDKKNLVVIGKSFSENFKEGAVKFLVSFGQKGTEFLKILSENFEKL